MHHVHSNQLTIDQAIADVTADQTQARELQRVNDKIRPAVLAFCSSRNGLFFNMYELESWVVHHLTTSGAPIPSPGSAGRIMRLLAAEGEIAYVVVNRRQSLYQLKMVREGARQ